MTTVNITFAPSSDDLFPLHARYGGQLQDQPAYISLDLETGNLTADYSGVVGSGEPAGVYHGIVRHWPVSNMLSTDEIKELLESETPYFQGILDRSSIEWDGNNYVGRIEGLEDGADWFMEQSRFEGVEPEGGVMESFSDWLMGQNVRDAFPRDGQAVSDFIAEIHGMDGEGGAYFRSAASSLDEVRDMVLDVWADLLYGDHELPTAVAQELIADGRCADSAWTDELAEYATK